MQTGSVPCNQKLSCNEIYHFSRLSHQTGCFLTWAAFFVESAPYPAILDHETNLKILGFILSSREKVKPASSFSSVCMFAGSNGKKS